MLKQFWKILLTLALSLYMAASMAALDVNKANAAELDAIKGIGPATSERIIEARKTGEFKNWSDLMARVKGIGHKNAKRFAENGLTVNGVGAEGVPEKAVGEKGEKGGKALKGKAPKADAPKAMKESAVAAPAEKMDTAASAKDARKADKAAAKAAKDQAKEQAKADKAALKP